MGLLGLSGEERGQPGGGARPPLPQSELDKEGGAPLFPSPSLLPSLLLLLLGKGVILLPVGVGLPRGFR